MFRPLRLSPRLNVLRPVRWNSTSSPASPPLLAKIRTDLKDAMRAKDKSRLNVLRTVITEINNSVKTASPIQTDLQLLSWMRRRIAGAQQLTEEFAKAGRADLQQAEEVEATILEEYAGQVETMSQDDINAIVSQEISKIKDAGSKVQIGPLLKALFAPGGAMEGKPAERSEVARIAKEAVAAT